MSWTRLKTARQQGEHFESHKEPSLFQRRWRFLLVTCALLIANSAHAPAGVRIRKRKYPPDLAEIISRMGDAGKRLRTLSANLEYTKVTVLVNDKSTEHGEINFHESSNREILIKFVKPDPKTILIKKNRAQIYNPKTNQIQEYDLGPHKELVEQFFLLGFGKGTQDLKKHYDVKFIKEENLGGDITANLELTPRREAEAARISKVLLWISEDSWLPVQQEFFEPDGDYTIARYSAVKVNRQLSSSVFEIDAAPGAKRVKMN